MASQALMIHLLGSRMSYENGQWMPLLRLMVANAVGVAAWAYVSVEAGDEALELYCSARGRMMTTHRVR